MKRRIKGQLAEELIRERLDRIAVLPTREQREEEVTDLIMGMAEALAITASTYLKHTPDQPAEFGKHCGEYITECMSGMRSMLIQKGLLRDETDTDKETNDPWS